MDAIARFCSILHLPAPSRDEDAAERPQVPSGLRGPQPLATGAAMLKDFIPAPLESPDSVLCVAQFAASPKPSSKVKDQRRPSASKSLHLFYAAAAVIATGGVENNQVVDLQSFVSSDYPQTHEQDPASASRPRRDSKHQHTPSFNFDDETGFNDSMDAPFSLDPESEFSQNLDLDSYILFNELEETDPRVVNMFSNTVAALSTAAMTGTTPAVGKVDQCTGGVYILGNNESIFKPQCEEAIEQASLKLGDPSPLRNGFVIGDGAIREVAAYHLDRNAGHFANVPATTLISVRSDVVRSTSSDRARGSLQEYCENIGSSEDFGSGKFLLQDIQAIAILDIRLFNTDRHGGNMLVSDSSITSEHLRLTPIDHGLCLPDFYHLEEFEAEWLFWRQAHEPLTEASKAHVAAIDIEKDAATLSSLGMRGQSVLTMQLMTAFLKYAVLELNWTLRQIGVFLTRSHLQCMAPQSDAGDVPTTKFKELLQRAVAASEDPSLVGFLRGDGSVAFSDARAQALVAAAQKQWRQELTE